MASVKIAKSSVTNVGNDGTSTQTGFGTWMIKNSAGTVIASNSSDAGFNVSLSSTNLVVFCSLSASVQTDCIAYYKSTGTTYYYKAFDIIESSTTIKRGETKNLPSNDTTLAFGTGITWQVWYNANLIADSSSTNGWTVTNGGSNLITVIAPLTADISANVGANDYEVRLSGLSTSTPETPMGAG